MAKTEQFLREAFAANLRPTANTWPSRPRQTRKDTRKRRASFERLPRPRPFTLIVT